MATHSIEYQPELPTTLTEISGHTHTWMGESIKGAVTLQDPVWLSHKTGSIFSQLGPFTELYDHSQIEKNEYVIGLTPFISYPLK